VSELTQTIRRLSKWFDRNTDTLELWIGIMFFAALLVLMVLALKI